MKNAGHYAHPGYWMGRFKHPPFPPLGGVNRDRLLRFRGTIPVSQNQNPPDVAFIDDEYSGGYPPARFPSRWDREFYENIEEAFTQTLHRPFRPSVSLVDTPLFRHIIGYMGFSRGAFFTEADGSLWVGDEFFGGTADAFAVTSKLAGDEPPVFVKTPLRPQYIVIRYRKTKFKVAKAVPLHTHDHSNTLSKGCLIVLKKDFYLDYIGDPNQHISLSQTTYSGGPGMVWSEGTRTLTGSGNPRIIQNLPTNQKFVDVLVGRAPFRGYAIALTPDGRVVIWGSDPEGTIDIPRYNISGAFTQVAHESYIERMSFIKFFPEENAWRYTSLSTFHPAEIGNAAPTAKPSSFAIRGGVFRRRAHLDYSRGFKGRWVGNPGSHPGRYIGGTASRGHLTPVSSLSVAGQTGFRLVGDQIRYVVLRDEIRNKKWISENYRLHEWDRDGIRPLGGTGNLLPSAPVGNLLHTESPNPNDPFIAIADRSLPMGRHYVAFTKSGQMVPLYKHTNYIRPDVYPGASTAPGLGQSNTVILK